MKDNIETVLTIDYKPGYGPNGSILVRLYYRFMTGLIVFTFLALPALALLGLWFLLKMVF